VMALAGKSVQQLARESEGREFRVPAAVSELEGPVNAIFDQVELPDGVFIEEAIAIIKQKISSPQALILPPGIQFILDARSKIKIAAVRPPCTCEYVEKHKQCLFLFTPLAGPENKRDVRYYQPLGAGLPGGVCDDQAQCVDNFARRDFQFYLPNACGHIFRTKPGNVLFTM
jgi:hypothetical protein